jgi:predicted membrane-bound spermidine synthase
MSSTTPAAATTGVTLAKPAPRWVFFAVFAISGFSGLIYESIWSHYLKLFLGHAAYAQSLVLIIFMGGLGLGSWLVARLSQRWRSPLIWYALVEGVIGLLALVFHKTFVSMSDTFYFSLLPSIDSVWLGSLLKWSAAAALILPQSVLLGMTFPLMSTGVIRRYPDHSGGSLAMLYFTNSIGAAVGVLASGFWLIALVGLPGTILTAGLLNVAIAVVVWVLVKLDPSPATEPIPVAPARAASNDGVATLFLAAAAITGASSFMYEIGWLRMLSLVLGSTTHSFELMLSAFITGLAFGGLWIKRRIDRIEDAIRFSGWVQVLMGALAVLTLPLYVRTFDWMAAILNGLQQNDFGYQLFTMLSHGITLAIMVPTTFLAGTTLPLFTHALMRGRDGERAIGRVYAANTLGAIAGVLVAVHVLMPLFGLKQLIGIAAALDVLLGVTLLARSAPAQRVRSLVQGACVGAFALVFVISGVHLDPRRLGSGVYRYRAAELDPQTTVLFYRDGKTASISLMSRGSQATLATNGKPDASIQLDPARPPVLDEITMVMLGVLPLAYKPDAQRVANIGLGSGLTTHTLLGSSSVRRVDTVEIEDAMTIAAQGFGDRVARTFQDPRSAIHVEDAKTFFSQQKQPYDVIVAEPSNPWVSGVASLFSEEFYRSIGHYLAEDGVLIQWLQLYEFNEDLVSSVLKGLRQHFSDYAIYNTDNDNIVIVAKRSGRLPKPSFDGLFDGPLGPELGRVGLNGPEDVLVRKTGSKAIVDALLADTRAPANSDYFPFLDLNSGRARFRGESAGLFYNWSVVPLPLLEMLGVADVHYAAVTPEKTFMRTELIRNAETAFAALAPEAHRHEGRDAGGSTLTNWFHLLHETCKAQGVEQSWTDALHALARDSLAYLDARSAAELLAAAVPPECRDRLPFELRPWLDLYAAVAARDGRRMSDAAERVLDGADSRDLKYYALTAAMLGRLTSHEPERVMQLYEQHKDIAGDLHSSAEIRLMLALAKSRRELNTTESPRSLL